MTHPLSSYANEARTFSAMMLLKPGFDRIKDDATDEPFAQIAINKDDFDCLDMFIAKMVSPSSSPEDFTLSNELDSCPCICEMVKKMVDKRKVVLRNAEGEAYKIYEEFKTKIINLMKTDLTLMQCANDSPIEASWAITSFTNMRMLYSAQNTYVSMNSTPEARENVRKMSPALLLCLKKLIEGVPLVAENLDASLETFKPYLLKLSDVLVKVNQELRDELIQDFKQMLTKFLSVFMYWRFPVLVSPTTPEIFFGKFMVDFGLQSYLDYVQIRKESHFLRAY